jgi:hypothetical protein
MKDTQKDAERKPTVRVLAMEKKVLEERERCAKLLEDRAEYLKGKAVTIGDMVRLDAAALVLKDAAEMIRGKP